jgi:undecaprenyl diphosphate synthase
MVSIEPGVSGKQQLSRIPRHIAIVMDGNGRWARQRGLPRTEGHREGARRVKEIARTCIDLGVHYLTIYAFSKENWKRPRPEVNAIMKLTDFFYRREFGDLRDEGVFFVHLGDRLGLPRSVIRVLDNIERNNSDERRLTLSIAFNYSGRSEIVNAARVLAEKVRRGELKSEDITEERFSSHLFTADIPDPDLLIRTAGELRVSNYLLWQIAYSEIWVTETLWPDFSGAVLRQAVEDFQGRERRFGGAPPSGRGAASGSASPSGDFGG